VLTFLNIGDIQDLEGEAYVKRIVPMVLSLIIVGLSAGGACATSQGRQALLLRDNTYEQDLHWQASADKTITPAKAWRWFMGLRGQPVSAPSQTEFQPIFNAHDGHIRMIAAIAYKF
jgi:hypothetical protein